MKFSTNNIVIKFYSLILKYNFKSKSLIIKILNKLIPKDIYLLEKETNILFKLDRDDAITKIILSKKSYENQSINRAKEILIKTKGVFIDIGSNFGLYTCLLGNYAEKTLSIEASPKAMTKLLDNLSINKFQKKIIPILYLINSKSEISGFTHDNTNLGKSRINYTSEPEFFMHGNSINKIVEKFIAKNEEIALVKIDIEGAELDTFINYDFNKYSPKNILMEYEPLNNQNVYKTIDVMFSHGYTAYNIDGSIFESVPTIEQNIWFKKEI